MTSRTKVLFVRLLRGARSALVCGGLGLCFATWLLPIHVASAQNTSAQNAGSSSDAYKQLIEQALSEFRHKNWPEARVLFRRAHDLCPSARTLRGMGVVSYEMRDYVQAVRDLDAALKDARQPLNAEQRSEAETLLSRARTFVGVYKVTVEPEGAALSVDGSKAQQDGEGALLLPFGEHTLTANAEGYETGRTQVTVQGGEHGEVKLALVPIHANAPLSAVSEDAPPRLEVASDAPRELQTTQTEPRGKLRYTWVALGAGAVFGGSAALFWFLGESKIDKIEERCADRARAGTPCKPSNTDTGTIDRYQLLTNVSLGLTGAAVIATGVLAFIEWPRAREQRVAVGVGPSSLSVRGAF